MDNLIFTSESVILYERKRIHALKYEEIICITTDRPYLVITTVESLQMFIQMSLSKVGELLPDYFCLCNQSTIINLMLIYMKNIMVTFSYLSQRCWSLLKFLEDAREI